LSAPGRHTAAAPVAVPAAAKGAGATVEVQGEFYCCPCSCSYCNSKSTRRVWGDILGTGAFQDVSAPADCSSILSSCCVTHCICASGMRLYTAAGNALWQRCSWWGPHAFRSPSYATCKVISSSSSRHHPAGPTLVSPQCAAGASSPVCGLLAGSHSSTLLPCCRACALLMLPLPSRACSPCALQLTPMFSLAWLHTHHTRPATQTHSLLCTPLITSHPLDPSPAVHPALPPGARP
jgi:hypothetical protein